VGGDRGGRETRAEGAKRHKAGEKIPKEKIGGTSTGQTPFGGFPLFCVNHPGLGKPEKEKKRAIGTSPLRSNIPVSAISRGRGHGGKERGKGGWSGLYIILRKFNGGESTEVRSRKRRENEFLGQSGKLGKVVGERERFTQKRG